MGRGARTPIVSRDAIANPGPGAYESPERIGREGPKVLIHSRLNDKSRNDIPGPGHYNPTQILVR